MTKEKQQAKELIEKFLYLKSTFREEQMTLLEAKQCAIIAVDLMIKQTEWIGGNYPTILSETKYLNKVKKAIENYGK